MYTDTVGDQIVPSSNFWVMQVSHQRSIHLYLCMNKYLSLWIGNVPVRLFISIRVVILLESRSEMEQIST